MNFEHVIASWVARTLFLTQYHIHYFLRITQRWFDRKVTFKLCNLEFSNLPKAITENFP